jgi:hypothetical protein
MIKLIVITAALRMRSPVSERQYAMSDEHDQGAALPRRLHSALASRGLRNSQKFSNQDCAGLVSAF